MSPPSGWYKEFMAAHGVHVGSHKPKPNLPRKPATLGELHRAPFWFWLYCRNYLCGHRAAVPLAPFIIRWGRDVTIIWLRERLRCTVCGSLGADTVHPSLCHGLAIGCSPFPVDDAGPFSFGEDIDVCNLYSNTIGQAAINAF